MPRVPCPIGCTCGLHSSASTRFSGKRHTTEARLAISESQVGKVRTADSIRASSIGLKTWHDSLSQEERAARSKAISDGNPRSSTSGRLGWTGGEVGNDFARVLEPAGYVREFQVNYGPGQAAHYKLDFAHPEAKVNIELDGPYHDYTQDEERDARLRALGWRIIRISHS